jgi:hypothetical protein
MRHERKRYVLRREAGHPGFSNVVVAATSEDLRRLATELAAAGPNFRLQHPVRREHEPGFIGSIVFQAVEEEELYDLQTANWRFHIIRRVFWTLFTALAFYGVWSLFD